MVVYTNDQWNPNRDIRKSNCSVIEEIMLKKSIFQISPPFLPPLSKNTIVLPICSSNYVPRYKIHLHLAIITEIVTNFIFLRGEGGGGGFASPPSNSHLKYFLMWSWCWQLCLTLKKLHKTLKFQRYRRSNVEVATFSISPPCPPKF